MSVKFQSHCLARLDINLFQTSLSLINVLLQHSLILNSLRLGVLYIGRGAIQLFFSYAVSNCTSLTYMHSMFTILFVHARVEDHCTPAIFMQSRSDHIPLSHAHNMHVMGACTIIHPCTAHIATLC